MMLLPVIGRHGNYFGTVTRRHSTPSALLTETAYQSTVAIPVHVHEAPSLVLVLAGEFHQWTSGAEMRLGAGSVSYHPAGDAHSAAVRAAGTRAYDIEFLHEPEARVWDRRPRLGDEERLARIATRIFAESWRHDVARPLGIEELVIEVAAVIGRAPRAVPMTAWLSGVLEELRAPGPPPTIARLAEGIGVDASTLYRAFRRQVGCPPSAYVRHLRLVQAREALARTRLPIGRVAHDAGFYDHAHFTRTFTHAMGVTPSAYRRLLTKPA